MLKISGRRGSCTKWRRGGYETTKEGEKWTTSGWEGGEGGGKKEDVKEELVDK